MHSVHTAQKKNICILWCPTAVCFQVQTVVFHKQFSYDWGNMKGIDNGWGGMIYLSMLPLESTQKKL